MSTRGRWRLRCHASTALCCTLATLTTLPGAPAKAATAEGVHQSSTDVDAINIYEIAASDPVADYGSIDISLNPGGAATAFAQVACGESATCLDPGAVEQAAVGLHSATNRIGIVGTQEIHAFATASGSTALARALIDTAVMQQAAAPALVDNQVSITGVLDLPLHAEAKATDGDALASAILDNGILQQASASDGVAHDLLDNHGTIAIDLSATAEGDSAAAFAILRNGIGQDAIGRKASAELVNDLQMTFGAVAKASGNSAVAAGSIALAIHQQAAGTAALVSIANFGAIDVAATGIANGGHAVAAGLIGIGVLQEVSGSKPRADFENSGELALGAHATAIASGDGSSYDAIAQAVDLAGIVQNVSGADAGARLTNAASGVISIDIGARAVATNASSNGGDAIAFAQLGTAAIEQSVDGKKGGATAQLSNAGLVDVLIGATAVADGSAFAEMSAAHIILQQVHGVTSASAALANSGTIVAHGSASAIGGTAAIAIAEIGVGISQSVTAVASTGKGAAPPSSAVAKVDNDGLISLGVGARADGDSMAQALATVGVGIELGAVADTFASGELINSRTIALTAAATATGDSAYARGLIERGIAETAFVLGASGTAAVDIDNVGTIAMAIDAHAQGDVAIAIAQVANGVRQLARGGADVTASAGLDNEGLIAIDVTATAQGTRDVLAFAVFGDGDFFPRTAAVAQAALGQAGAEAAITNHGTIAFAAHADVIAQGDSIENVFADANGRGGISQIAIASSTEFSFTHTGNVVDIHTKWTPTGAASATISNSGLFSLSADATAISSGYGQAEAALERPIFQLTHGSQADAQIDNFGTIAFHAFASVQAGGAAYADAVIETIQQIATAVKTERFFALTTPSSYGAATFTSSVAGPASAEIINSGMIALEAIVHAEAGSNSASSAAYSAQAIALVPGALQLALGTDAEVRFKNEGSFDITIKASATGEENAIAFALGGLIFQNASAFGSYLHVQSNSQSAMVSGSSNLLGPASVMLVNDGLLMVDMDATAIGDAHVSANAGASAEIGQLVRGETAAASIVNIGTIVFDAHLLATGDSASAGIKLGGIQQTATAISTFHSFHVFATPSSGFSGSSQQLVKFEGSADVTLANSGLIEVAASLSANGEASAFAHDYDFFLVRQFTAALKASDVIANDGTMVLYGHAVAKAEDVAWAALSLADPVAQVALASTSGGEAAVTLVNHGLLSIAATVSADGGSQALGQVRVGTTGTSGAAIIQVASGGAASASLANSGTIEILAHAKATGVSFATASASVLHGIMQFASATDGNAHASLNNIGAIKIYAVAEANGDASAKARAVAEGITQTAMGATDGMAFLNMGNHGTIDVGAAAIVSAEIGQGSATANGYRGHAHGGGTLTATITNSGTMNVSATAVAPGTAIAVANGIILTNAATTTTEGTGTTAVVNVNGQGLAGVINNTGTLNVVAFASGGGTFTTGTGATATTVSLSSATATGILMGSGVNNLTVWNTGSINVDAIAANGGNATAYGIRATTIGDSMAGVGDLLTINNAGDLIVRVSNDGGDTWHRGQAIDVTDAPNPTVVNLMGAAGGAANVYGNIDLQSDADAINVTNGETVFNGVINSYCMPAGGPGALTLDNPAQNACGVGDLTISDDGDLHLVIDATDGPSYGFVNTLTIEEDGTIEYDLPPADGTEPIGSYPQIFANVVMLNGGTLIANIQNGNGLYETTVYDNVIDGTDLTGTFDQCIAPGILANSLLLDFGCVYDNADNVDLRVLRTPFTEVPGLNQNGEQVGGSLECIYDVSLTGGMADMLADLFLFSNAANYNTALNMLSGSVYANYLQSFPSLGVHYNALIDHATNCEIPALAGSVLECRGSAPIHVWGQFDYQWRSADGDVEAGDAKAKRITGLLGVDANVGTSAIIGASAGYVTNHVKDHQFGDSVDADGMQVGLYGVYDPGSFFVKGMTTYSWYDGDASRHINFNGLATGATFIANLQGDPDVKMWTFGLHGGARFAMGGNSVITPYLNYDYVNAKMDGFTETSANGVGLTAESAKSNHSFLTGGVKWATQMGGVVPEMNVGYRYRFGDSRSNFHGYFIGDQDCDFNIISASQNRGSFVAGVSVGGKLGPVDVRIGYEGEFNGDVTSHSGNFKFVLPLGGHKAPPPPPPPVAAPPPPPVEVAPPPPPPPPVERGERGQ